MDNSIILKKNHSIVARVIGDEVILVPLYRTNEEVNCIYTLNDVARRIWELIDGKKTLGKIKKILLEEYDITKEKLDKKLNEFLKDLENIRAISL